MNRVALASVVCLLLLAGCQGLTDNPQADAGTATGEIDIGASTDTPTTTKTEGETPGDEVQPITETPAPTETPTPTSTPTPTASPTPTPIQSITVTAAHNEFPDRALGDEAAASVRFLADHPELNKLGVGVEFDPNASRETADVVIEYRHDLKECGGESTNSSFAYCSYHLTDRDDLRANYTISVRGVYTDEVVREKTIQALSMFVGQEEPTSSAAVPDPELRYAHPWGEDSLVVNITYATSVERQYTERVRDAVNYWEANDERYGTYAANWTVKPNASKADLTVTVTDYIHRCGRSEANGSSYLGCADLLNKTTYVEHGDIRVVDGLVPEDTTSVLKHEFGHVHGIEHGQEPLPLMLVSGVPRL